MEPDFLMTDFAKMERPGQLHLGFVVRWQPLCFRCLDCCYVLVSWYVGSPCGTGAVTVVMSWFPGMLAAPVVQVP